MSWVVLGIVLLLASGPPVAVPGDPPAVTSAIAAAYQADLEVDRARSAFHEAKKRLRRTPAPPTVPPAVPSTRPTEAGSPGPPRTTVCDVFDDEVCGGEPARRVLTDDDSETREVWAPEARASNARRVNLRFVERAAQTLRSAKAEAAAARRTAELLHDTDVQQQWVWALAERDDGPAAIPAVRAFLSRYSRHPLGNPKVSDASRRLDMLVRRAGARQH